MSITTLDLRHTLVCCALELARLDPPEGTAVLWLFAPGADGLALRTVLIPRRRFVDADDRAQAAGRTLRARARSLSGSVCRAPAAIAVFLPIGEAGAGVLEVAGPVGEAVLAPFERACTNVGAGISSVPRHQSSAAALFGCVWTSERGCLN